MKRSFHAGGFTLIELVIAIAVIGAAAVALLGAMTFISKDSGETMVRQQASTLAHAYLDEVLSRPVVDPNGGTEPGRQQFDDVADYDGINDSTGARDQFGALIPGLQEYAVTVQVVNGMLGAGATALPAGTARRVDVTVRHSSGFIAVATGYRTP